MKTLKIAFGAAFVAAISFSSFMVINSANELPIDKALYEKFLHTFPKVEMPYSIQFERPKNEEESEKIYGWSSEKEKNYGAEISYEFAKFIPALERGYMSRMGPDEFYSDAMLASTDKFSAVVYKRKPNYQNHITSYILATFDKTGKMISQRTIGSCYPDYFEEPTIAKDLKISVAHYKAERKEDAEKSITYSLEKSEQMHISETGEIIAASDKTPVMLQKAQNTKDVIKADLWNN